MKDFYNRVDFLLKTQGKTKEDLAKTLGLSSVQVFYNWKNLEKVPDMNTVVKIAEYLATTTDYLATGKENSGYKDKYDNLKKAVLETVEKN